MTQKKVESAAKFSGLAGVSQCTGSIRPGRAKSRERYFRLALCVVRTGDLGGVLSKQRRNAWQVGKNVAEE